MALLDMFDKIKSPTVLKDNEDFRNEIKELEVLYESKTGNDKKRLENLIKNMKKGLQGEEQIIFELKHSGIPMFIIQDLYLVDENDLSCQIDCLIITRYNIYIIESKNIYGNITINNSGDFIRTTNNKKIRMYSPITQNQRHLEVLKSVRGASLTNFIIKNRFLNNFDNMYHNLVVIANSSSMVNSKYAPKGIKSKLVQVDYLASYIKKMDSKKEVKISGKDFEDVANFYLRECKVNPKKYMDKFKEDDSEDVSVEKSEVSENVVEKDLTICPKCGSKLVKRVSNKGKYENSEFYGCSNFPKCRYISNDLGE